MGVETDRQTETKQERENSQLYYTRIKILDSCLLLQSVPERDRDTERQTDRQTDR